MTPKKTAMPAKTPLDAMRGGGQKSKFEETMYQRNLFLAMALNMTWQLAVVVLVPIIGGYELDKHLDSSPLYTLIGVVLAFGGVAAVLYRVVKEANERASGGKGGK